MAGLVISYQPESNILGPVPGDDGGPIRIRPMTEQDSENVANLQIEAFRGKVEWAVGKSNVNKVSRAWGNGLRRSPQWWPRYFVAELSDEFGCHFAGAIVLGFYADRSLPEPHFDTNGLSCKVLCGMACMDMALAEKKSDPSKGYVETICVESKYRGKGIGKVLLDRAEYEAKAMGCRSIYLKVKRTNRAKNLYERQGYRVTKDHDGCCCTYCAVGIRHFYEMEKQLI
ncbi:uncharacterized protein LOC106181324 [Lingula anatina]|uniref:Uncharacterized protein LOC106181324 n=1 Tax=Lingula anatina TaxID=7574 RepID=A0A1S3KER1_LINAN|nr:uncharacterized protein LOC106181324 [Lingula anatina]|eukprot:XP_013421120.1 uncharacterized protein LOC106181324 [Lingula anatina]